MWMRLVILQEMMGRLEGWRPYSNADDMLKITYKESYAVYRRPALKL